MIAQFAEDGGQNVLILVSLIFSITVTFLVVYLVFYRKVGPNEAMIVSGRKQFYRDEKGRMRSRGYRMQVGGGTFVWPFMERAEVLSLELMAFEVRTPEIYALKETPVIVQAMAQVKINGDQDSIARAAELFLSKSLKHIRTIALETLEGHIRAITAQMTVEQIKGDRDLFADRIIESAQSDFDNMGMAIETLTIKNAAATGKSEPAVGDDFNLTSTCPIDSCGAENPENARFCCRCAAPMS